MRSFLTNEESSSAQVVVETSYSSCAQCCRIWSYLYLGASLAAVVFLGGVQYFGRHMMFLIAFFALGFLLMIWARVRRSQAYLDRSKRSELRQWRASLRGNQELLFFHNVAEHLPGM